MSKKHHTAKHNASSRAGNRNGKGNRRTLRWLWIGLGVIAVAAAAFLFLKPGPVMPAEISVARAFQKYQQGAVFVDVRSQAEWDQTHIARSILIPLDDLSSRLNELPRDQEIVVVCKSGVRSKEGARILLQAGFSRVSCMSGGMQAWMAAGYPVEQ